MNPLKVSHFSSWSENGQPRRPFPAKQSLPFAGRLDCQAELIRRFHEEGLVFCEAEAELDVRLTCLSRNERRVPIALSLSFFGGYAFFLWFQQHKEHRRAFQGFGSTCLGSQKNVHESRGLAPVGQGMW